MEKLTTQQKNTIRSLFTDLRSHRRKRRMNQMEFWMPLGVTQSGGSRYESVRTVPTATAILLALREIGVVCDDDLHAVRKLVEPQR